MERQLLKPKLTPSTAFSTTLLQSPPPSPAVSLCRPQTLEASSKAINLPPLPWRVSDWVLDWWSERRRREANAAVCPTLLQGAPCPAGYRSGRNAAIAASGNFRGPNRRQAAAMCEAPRARRRLHRRMGKGCVWRPWDPIGGTAERRTELNIKTPKRGRIWDFKKRFATPLT